MDTGSQVVCNPVLSFCAPLQSCNDCLNISVTTSN
uniref:Uncharacterized protein n=1 Tax=Arundo donax TaxID=35708 RepID=A0A0A9EQZ6_ARUDO